MKPSKAFKETIENYLKKMAESDPLFNNHFQKEGKNIDDCITFIFNQVKKSGCAGFADDEIFGMAVHYYTEDKIDIGKAISCQVVVNHQVQLTPEEIEKARKTAKEQLIQKEMDRMKEKPRTKIVPRIIAPEDEGKPPMTVTQQSLF